MKPKRISIGCYAVVAGGRQVVLQRVPGRGFKIVMRPGRKAPIFRRLRDAAAAAIDAADPWPFTVEKKKDLRDVLAPFVKKDCLSGQDCSWPSCACTGISISTDDVLAAMSRATRREQ